MGCGRGRAPLGYIKGMAVMFAVALRKLAQGDPAAVEMARAATGDGHRDALAYYASRFAALGMRNDVSGIDTLRHLFVLMIGLGMRELSGRYCEGRDQHRQQHQGRHGRGRAVPDELGRAQREPADPEAARRVSGQRRRLSRNLLPKASRRAAVNSKIADPAPA